MTIRKAQLSDIENLASLFDMYRVFYEMKSNIIESKQFLKTRIENQETQIFVAENSDNKLIGFVQLFPIFSSTRLKKMWLLNDLFVLESQRGKGISVLLIDECKKLSVETNACGLSLETAKSNTIGNNLYTKTDFILDIEHNYYFWNNNDGI